ncbi:alpha-glucosidase maltase, partial [Pyrenophora tritici-repentis]
MSNHRIPGPKLYTWRIQEWILRAKRDLNTDSSSPQGTMRGYYFSGMRGVGKPALVVLNFTTEKQRLKYDVGGMRLFVSWYGGDK